MVTASPAQIAARKAFVAKVRAGAFKKKAPKRKKNPQEDFAQPAAPKGPPAHRKMNPGKAPVGSQRLGHAIAKLVQAGLSLKDATAFVVENETIKPRADKLKGALKYARELLNYPDPIRVTKKGVVRRNPVKRRRNPELGVDHWDTQAEGRGPALSGRRKNPTSPAHRSPSMFCVHHVRADGEPGALIAKFSTKALAVEYAKAFASAHKAQVGIIGKA